MVQSLLRNNGWAIRFQGDYPGMVRWPLNRVKAAERDRSGWIGLIKGGPNATTQSRPKPLNRFQQAGTTRGVRPTRPLMDSRPQPKHYGTPSKTPLDRADLPPIYRRKFE